MCDSNNEDYYMRYWKEYAKRKRLQAIIDELLYVIGNERNIEDMYLIKENQRLEKENLELKKVINEQRNIRNIRENVFYVY